MTAIKDIMNKSVSAVKPDTPLRKAAQVLVKKKISGLPVQDAKGRLVGFVSERDIITCVAKEGLKRCSVKIVKDVMTKRVVSVEENSAAEKLSKIFTDTPFRYLPVTKNKKIVGIVSRKDVIHKLLGQYY